MHPLSHLYLIHNLMKKMKIMLFHTCFILLQVMQMSAQTCASPISLTYATYGQAQTQSNEEQWFSFVASSSEVSIRLENLPNSNYTGHIHRFAVRTANCLSYTTLGNGIICQNPGADSTIEISVSNLTTGSTYHLVTEKEEVGCAKCAANARFAISISDIEVNCPFSYPDIYVTPGQAYSVYHGFLGPIAGSTSYHLQATQTSGTLVLNNFLIGMEHCDGNFYTVVNNYNGNAGTDFCFDGSSTLYTSFFISPNVNPGEIICIHLTLYKSGGEIACETDFCVTVCDDITASADVTICQGACATLTASGGTNYVWYGPGNIQVGTGASINVCPTSTTTYTVLPATGDVCPNFDNVVTVNVIPTFVEFLFTDQQCMNAGYAFSNLTPNAAAHQFVWDFGDGTPNSTAVNPTHTYTQPGTYTVTLTATNNSCVFSTSHVIQVTPSSCLPNASYNCNCCSYDYDYTYNVYNINSQAALNSFMATLAANNNNISVKGTLFISQNMAVNLSNVKIAFAPYGKIIIEKGSLLDLNTCELTGLKTCGTMWQGIEVWGDATKNQSQVNPQTGRTFQGKLVLRSCLVTDAHHAVISGKPSGVGFVTSFGGGIVDATTTQFTDNAVGIQFSPYFQFVNTSRIQYCVFSSATILDPGYLTNNPVGYTYTNAYNTNYAQANALGRANAFVLVHACKYLNIKDNSFDNAEYGVLAINAKINVIDGDGNGDGNDFKNLNYGVMDANVFSTLYGNRIEKNQFDQMPNNAPIYIIGGSGDRVIENEINPILNQNSGLAGMAFSGCQGLYVVDNIVNNCLVGTLASATGTQGGLIGFATRGNVFTSCSNGTITMGSNPALQIRCNDYKNNNNYLRNWLVNGTLANQGNFPILSDKDPAGNDLNSPLPGINDELWSNSFFNYYYHNPSLAFPATQPDVSLLNGNVLTTANFINTGFAKNNTSCNPIPCQPPCSQLAQLTTQVSDLQTELGAIVLDGNQTVNLVAAINSSMNETDLKTLLLANSPLSDLVLLAFIAKLGKTPETYRDVLLPNSPVSTPLRPALFASLVGLPSGIAAEIQSAQTNYDNRTPALVGWELESAKNTRQLLVNETVQYYVEQEAIDSAKNILLAETTFGSKQILVATYFSEGNYSAAQTLLNNMVPSKAEEQAFKDLFLMLYTVYSSGRNFYELTETEEQTVRTAATLPTPSTARSNARVILFAAFGEPIPFEYDELGGSRLYAPATDPAAENYQYLGPNYPNPFTQITAIPYFVPENSSGMLAVYDVNGKLVLSKLLAEGGNTVELNTENWQAGVYMYSISINGQEQEFRKMILIRQ